MRKAKKITSIILVLTLIFTISFTSLQTNALVGEMSETSADTYSLQDNCQDGVILHAWNASYNNIKSHLKDIAEAGFTTVQTSPVQQPKDYGGNRDVDGQWWKLYQPLSFSIAPGGSWLGSKSELTSLCTEAHKYGIKIICDIVANHTSNDGSKSGVDSNLRNYESQLYNNRNQYFHSYVDCDDSSIEHVVRGNIGEPDLNTGDSYVQSRAASLLEECISCGVDGFRFDAAKHIETPEDGAYASQFWPTVLQRADTAASKQNKTMYYYGEILNTCGSGRSVKAYTKYMSVTDNTTGNNRTASVNNHNASSVSSVNYNLGAAPNKSVLWAESHDTYCDGTSKKYNQEVIDKSYCFSTALKESTTLYFVRPVGDMGSFNSSTYKASQIAAANKFHNHFVGASQSTSSSDSLAICERYDGSDTGVLIVNCNGTSKDLSGVSVSHMANGTYKDIVTGGSVTVSSGKITSGSIGSSGVAAIFNDVPVNKPTNTISTPGGNFKTDTLTLTLGLISATSGTYKIGNGSKTTYTGTTTITIGKDMAFDESVTIYLTATDGTKSTEASYTFKKIDPTATPFKFPTSRTVYLLDTASWGNLNCYAWSGSGDNKNSNWPGVKMEDAGEYEGYKVYSYNVPSNLNNIIFNNSSSQTDDLTFQSYSYYDNGKKQWVNVGEPDPTTKPTEKPTDKPTEKPTEKPTSPTKPTEAPTIMPEPLYLGDTNVDGNIDVFDALLIQKYLANLDNISKDGKICGDVDESGEIEITDATYIQKYLAKISIPYDVGRKIQNVDPTEKPTSPTKPTEGTTYTVYVDMSSQGDVYAYYWIKKTQESPSSYPGYRMTHVNGTIYKISVEEKYDSIIFSVGNNKTPDLTIPGDNYIYSRQNGTWSVYGSNPTDATEPTQGGSIDFSNPRTIYAIKDGNWKNIYIHYWGNRETSWPGEKMTKVGTYNGSSLYSYTLPENTEGFVINSGSGVQSVDFSTNASYKDKVFSTKENAFINVK